MHGPLILPKPLLFNLELSQAKRIAFQLIKKGKKVKVNKVKFRRHKFFTHFCRDSICLFLIADRNIEGIIKFIISRNNAQRQLIVREFFRRYRRVRCFFILFFLPFAISVCRPSVL